jgi:outer membrane protein assembly factor BamB
MYSGLNLWRQVQVLCLFVSLQAVVYLAVRLEGFTGDARPIWKWRWTKTRQQSFTESRPERPTVNQSQTVDLASTSPWDSPGFRGQDRSGKMAARELQTDWQTYPPRLLWRHPIGSGWSTFAVVGDYCVTQSSASSMRRSSATK